MLGGAAVVQELNLLVFNGQVLVVMLGAEGNLLRVLRIVVVMLLARGQVIVHIRYSNLLVVPGIDQHHIFIFVRFLHLLFLAALIELEVLEIARRVEGPSVLLVERRAILKNLVASIICLKVFIVFGHDGDFVNFCIELVVWLLTKILFELLLARPALSLHLLFDGSAELLLSWWRFFRFDLDHLVRVLLERGRFGSFVLAGLRIRIHMR